VQRCGYATYLKFHQTCNASPAQARGRLSLSFYPIDATDPIYITGKCRIFSWKNLLCFSTYDFSPFWNREN
jgi:hypothetical protein